MHKKVKLAVLKYYKVDGDGKITRLRRECPADTCGAGVFMASHFDRQYVTLAAPVPLSLSVTRGRPIYVKGSFLLGAPLHSRQYTHGRCSGRAGLYCMREGKCACVFFTLCGVSAC